MKNTSKQDVTSVNNNRIIKDLERINKIKLDLRKGNNYYDEGIKPECRCRHEELSDSN